MTGPGGSASAMQQGGPGKGTKGPGRHSRRVPHSDQGQVALPRGPRAHRRPATRGRGRSQPRKCRQKWQGRERFFLLGPGAHPVIQK